jgi:hypothetical protein
MHDSPLHCCSAAHPIYCSSPQPQAAAFSATRSSILAPNSAPSMLEKHTRRTHNCASSEPHLTRNRRVFRPGRAGRWCKTQRILQLSSMFAHFGPSSSSKSLPMKRLLKNPRVHRAPTIRAPSARCIASNPMLPTWPLTTAEKRNAKVPKTLHANDAKVLNNLPNSTGEPFEACDGWLAASDSIVARYGFGGRPGARRLRRTALIVELGDSSAYGGRHRRATVYSLSVVHVGSKLPDSKKPTLALMLKTGRIGFSERWLSGRKRRFAKSVKGSNPSAGSNPVLSAPARCPSAQVIR